MRTRRIFRHERVDFATSFLQGHMARHRLASMTADECAELLHKAGLLTLSRGTAPGSNFRELLRKRRDGKIPLVDGAYQRKKNERWAIRRKLAVLD